MLTTVLPQLIDGVGLDGTVTPGLFSDRAARILGQGSFDHDNKENRWRTFMASDSALAVEFRGVFERAKAINLELRSRLAPAAGEVLPVSIFDEPIEGFVADISKLHRRITGERDGFRSRDLSQRAANLPITDPRRMVFFANSNDSFAKSLSTAAFPFPVSALRTHNGVQQMRCISMSRFRH
jgi:hypothetical protein